METRSVMNEPVNRYGRRRVYFVTSPLSIAKAVNAEAV